MKDKHISRVSCSAAFQASQGTWGSPNTCQGLLAARLASMGDAMAPTKLSKDLCVAIRNPHVWFEERSLHAPSSRRARSFFLGGGGVFCFLSVVVVGVCVAGCCSLQQAMSQLRSATAC